MYGVLTIRVVIYALANIHDTDKRRHMLTVDTIHRITRELAEEYVAQHRTHVASHDAKNAGQYVYVWKCADHL